MPWFPFPWFGRRPARRALVLETGPGGVPTVLLGGRARAAGVPYLLPKDLGEANRLDFQHYVLRHALQGIFAPPLRDPRDILDVGTGTGRWAREMADLFPRAHVVGVDIAPPPADDPTLARADLRPKNYAFRAANLLEGLPFPDASFDFVHMRLLVTAIPHDRWPFVVGELARVTRPGGWVESVEATIARDGGPAMDRLMAWIEAALARRGVIFADGADVARHLATAGLVDLVRTEANLPIGAWGGRVGTLLAQDVLTGAAALGGALAAAGITTQEEFDRTLAAARVDVDAPQHRCIFPAVIAFGRRP